MATDKGMEHAEPRSPWIDEQTWKNRWEKLEALNGGAQGDVFRARSLVDGTIGFLKIIKSKNDPERKARFFREATAYDSFGIAGIPKLIESNAHRHSDKGVTPFIVTEFIVGTTLRSWRESQASVPIETAISITLRLLDVLQACHAQGCVHRDVKPDNIILEGGDPERFWLLDFGISHHDLADTDFQTEHWQEVGNRFLRLPELSAGSLLKQDPRSDVCFAAGIFFYLLTGDHPDVLQDGEGRLPHQRMASLEKLRNAASNRLLRLLAFFDEAFATRLVNRIANVQVMRERMDKMMQDLPGESSVDEDLAALREMLDTASNRRLATTIATLENALRQVQHVFEQVQQSIGGTLSISQTGWNVTGEHGQNTLFWNRQGSTDRILSVTYEFVPAGEELLLRMSGDDLFRTELAEPDFGANFKGAIRTWLLARLRAVMSDPVTHPPETDLFGEIKPFGLLEVALAEARRRNCAIIAFVYDPAQPERGKLRWALKYFLENRRTHNLMNQTFVTAVVPLSAVSSFTDILTEKSMETARWLVLNQELQPLEQQVIQANPQTAEQIMGELAKRYSILS